MDDTPLPSPPPSQPAAPSVPTDSAATARQPTGQPRVQYVYRGEGSGWLQVFLWTLGKVFLQFFSVLCFHVRVAGRENVPAKGGALLVTNHQSMLDPWMIGIALHRQIHFMARESLFFSRITHPTPPASFFRRADRLQIWLRTRRRGGN